MLKASWFSCLLLYIVAWTFNNQNLFTLAFVEGEKVDDTVYNQFSSFVHIFSGTYAISWGASAFENAMITVLFMVNTAATIGHLRWGLKNKELFSPEKEEKTCILCSDRSPVHIKYIHNAVKWIDFEINLKSRCESSLSYFEKFLKEKIEKRDLTLAYHWNKKSN